VVRLGLEDRGSIPGWDNGEIYSHRHCVQIDSGAHTARGSYPMDKATNHEANHLPPSGAEVKNARSYTSTPPHVFKALSLGKKEIRFHVTVLS